MRALYVLLLGVIGGAFVTRGWQKAAKLSADADADATTYELSRSPFGLHVIDNRDLDGPVEIGARWTRHMALWKRIEPRQGAIVGLDQVVRPFNALTDAGIDVLPRIVSVAPWAHSERINRLNAEAARKRLPMGDWTYLGMPTDIASYRRFLTTLVEAFDGDGFKDAPGLKRGQNCASGPLPPGHCSIGQGLSAT